MRRFVAAMACVLLATSACDAASEPRSEGGPTASDKPEKTSPGPLEEFAAGRSEPVRDPVFPDYGSPSTDVLHYNLELKWEPKNKRLTGTATLTVRPTQDLTEIALDFSDKLKIEKAEVDGVQVDPTHKKHDLTLPDEAAADEAASVMLSYSGRPRPAKAPMERAKKIGLGIHVGDKGTVYAVQEPYGAFTWYPVNDHPSDEALYDIAITVPKGWAAVSAGEFQGKTGSGGTRTFTWSSKEPVASYLVPFAIDKFTMERQKGPRGLSLVYWVRRGDRKKELPKLRKSPKIIKWLEKRYGRYPFSSAGAVVADRGGMETQTTITMSPGMLEPVYVHEYAHQWFGNAVTPKTWEDVWLNEGFATYNEAAWYAEHNPATLDEVMDGFRREDAQLRREFGPPGKVRKKKFLGPNVYLIPALMLHKIRKKVGTKKFYAMAKGWVAEHRDTSQDREAFIDWVEESTGKDLSKLVNKWLDSKTTPK